MSPLFYALLAMIAVAALGIALVPGILGPSRADKRMQALQGDPQVGRREVVVARTRELRRRSVQETLKVQTEEMARSKRKAASLARQIEQAGMKIKPRDFIRNQIILGFGVFLLCFLLQVPLFFALIFGVACGYLAPRWYLKRRIRRFQDKFLEELPNAVEAIVRGVRSGLPLNDSMRLVAKEVKEPVRSEFQRVLDQQSVGKSMTEAVSVLLERVPLSEVNFFVVVITVQQQAGGNLSEALGNLARVLRNRKKMKQKVKAMSAEAKASAMIIGSLPFVVSLLVTLTTPNYMLPLVETPVGLFWLGIAAVLMGTGVFVMNRMIKFDF
ncbi:MAG: type II secretion system F family protein [Devosia sp.]